MTRGTFITFEGGEGVGKSTQIKLLEQALTAKGDSIVLTREPGGCSVAEDIRNLIFNPKYGDSLSAKSETLLMFAARDAHLKEVIRPALNSGKIILCDRFMDSTRVYQGSVKGVDMAFIDALEKEIIADDIPDLTFILDLPADAAMARVKGRGVENRHDEGDKDFYEGLRQGFLKLSNHNPDRYVTIDASQDIEAIATQILSVVEARTK